MRLIRCHIENFGRLRDFDYDLTAGKNVVLEENGWGKSTLASFIRIMFYGFSGEGRRKNELENERKRYLPWQSGVYGGSIIFETDRSGISKKYRIERIFDSKKAADDEFHLYDDSTNLESPDYSNDIGEELFGIDIDSFERTVFIAQQDCGTSVTAGINAKMGNVAHETADMGIYEDVQKRLKDELNALSPTRSTGELKKLKNRIAELDSGIRTKPVQQHAIDELKESLDASLNAKKDDEEKLDKVQAKIQEIGKIKDIRAEYEKYDALRKAVDESEKKTHELASYFPKDVPEKDQIGKALDDQEKYEKAKGSASDYALSAENKTRLEKLSDEFRDGIPGEEAFDEADRKISAIDDLKNEKKQNALSDSEAKKLHDDERYFSDYKPDIDEADRLIDDLAEADRLAGSLTPRRDSAALMKTMRDKDNESTKRRKTMLTTAGICAVLVGAVLVILSFIVPAAGNGAAKIIMMIFGIICAVVGALSMMTGMNSGRSRHTSDVSDGHGDDAQYELIMDNIERDEDFIDDTDDKVRKLFDRMDVPYSKSEAESELHRIRQMLREYDDLKGRYDEFMKEDIDGQISLRCKELLSFIRKYHPEASDDEFAKNLEQIRYDARDFMRLKDQAGIADRFEKESSESGRAVAGFIRNLGIVPEDDADVQLTEIRDRVISLREQKEWLKKRRDALDEYEKGYDISKFEILKNGDMTGDSEGAVHETGDIENSVHTAVSSTKDGNSLEGLSNEFNSLKDEIDSISERITSFRKQIEDAGELMEQIENDETELTENRERYDDLDHRYKLIDKTRDYLERAKISFTGKYMDPIKESYDRYYKMISPDNAVYELDANLNIKLREEGSLHDTELMSEGYKDLVGLCRRMAMVDAMYKEEKPFLIFDDPFVNLDDTRLAGAQRFIDDIASKYQVIYLVCSSERK